MRTPCSPSPYASGWCSASSEPAACTDSLGRRKAPEKPERTHARQEEVIAAANVDEAGQGLEPLARRLARDGEGPRFALVGADERVSFVVETGKLRVVHPGLLDELELAPDARVQTDEEQTTLLTVV